jgi:trans-aconitate 2-methyltransferase
MKAMPDWDAAQYLKFQDERTCPCHDLAARLSMDPPPANIVDLGCGPGNSTEVIAARFPGAAITALDSSQDMIATARQRHPDWNWLTGDIAAWSGQAELLFSNAALQWVPNHETLLPRLLGQTRMLAVQMPANADAPAHQIASRLLPGVHTWHIHDVGFYYDVLSPHAKHLDIWLTEYQHVLPNADAIVEWYKGTGLRPYLESLPDASSKDAFLSEYRSQIRVAYPARRDGKVILPFRRLFFIAQASRPATNFY